MSQTAAATATFKVEHSWEATTLDYLSPLWYVTQEGFESEQAAEEFIAAKRAEREAAQNFEPIAYRTKRVAPQAEVDEFLEAEFAANRAYWAGQARAAEQAEAARKHMFETFGKGKVVKVVKGRKVPVGTEGTVFWLGEDKFSRTGGYRVGFKTFAGEKHFTALDNVEPVEGMEEVGA